MPLEFDGVNGIVKNTTSDGDVTIKGNDDGSEISALVFDMSAAGAATFNDKITAVGTSVFTNLDISGDIDVDGTTNLDVVDIDGAVDMASTLTVTGAAILNGGIDVAGDFNFDVGGGDITFKDDGTSVVNFGLESGNFIVNATASDTDIIFKGNDGGSAITALTLDMSSGGQAVFLKGITVNDHVYFGDGDFAVFGGSNDLQIYHDGTNSYIQDNGAGDLKIISNGNAISFQKGTTETMAFFDTDAGCELYHNNVAKFVTDAEGANLTGTLDVSSRVVVAGGTEATTTSDGSIATAGGLSVTKDTVLGDDLKMLSDGAVIHFGADSEITLTHVHNTGLVINSGAGSNTLQLQSTDAGGSSGPILNLYRNSSSPADDDILGQLKHTGRNSNSEDVIYSSIITTTKTVTNGSENGLVDINVMSAGSLLEFAAFQGSVGTVFNESSNDLDFRVESNGNANMLKVDGGNNRVGVGCDPSADFHVDSSGGGVIRVSRNSSSTSNFMALESDGTNGTVKAIQELIISAGGGEVARFTSGGLAIGGTGAANTLDDYEEGTWTPVLVSDATAAAYTSQTGVYTKIGRMVYINCQVRMSDVGSFAGATTQINGLPFTSSNNSTDNIGVLYMSGTASVVTNSYVRIPANSAFLRLEEGAGTTGVDNSLNANHLDTGTTVRFSMVYFT